MISIMCPFLEKGEGHDDFDVKMTFLRGQMHKWSNVHLYLIIKIINVFLSQCLNDRQLLPRTLSLHGNEATAAQHE